MNLRIVLATAILLGSASIAHAQTTKQIAAEKVCRIVTPNDNTQKAALDDGLAKTECKNGDVLRVIKLSRNIMDLHVPSEYCDLSKQVIVEPDQIGSSITCIYVGSSRTVVGTH